MEEDFDIDELDYTHCPLCESENISHGDTEVIPNTNGLLIQECRCNDCRATWNITGYIDIRSFECIQDGAGNEIATVID